MEIYVKSLNDLRFNQVEFNERFLFSYHFDLTSRYIFTNKVILFRCKIDILKLFISFGYFENSY